MHIVKDEIIMPWCLYNPSWLMCLVLLTAVLATSVLLEYTTCCGNENL